MARCFGDCGQDKAQQHRQFFVQRTDQPPCHSAAQHQQQSNNSNREQRETQDRSDSDKHSHDTNSKHSNKHRNNNNNNSSRNDQDTFQVSQPHSKTSNMADEPAPTGNEPITIRVRDQVRYPYNATLGGSFTHNETTVGGIDGGPVPFGTNPHQIPNDHCGLSATIFEIAIEFLCRHAVFENGCHPPIILLCFPFQGG